MNERDRKTREKARKTLIPLVLVAAAAVVVLVVVLLNIQPKSIDTVAEETTESSVPYNAVEIGGRLCVPKSNIKTYLFMGLDSEGEAGEIEEYDGTGQCDVLQVLVVDQDAGIYTRLPINRDTMTDVPILDEDGYYLSKKYTQISFAHVTGGDGMETSCENTVNAVSGLLLDQTIDGYASLNMDAIAILNHLVGGVTVTIEDDFSNTDPSLVMGETVTLTDDQALHYVHDRHGMGDESNENRMQRQSNYLSALEPILIEKCTEDINFALDIYDAMEPYMVTDISRNGFIKIAASLLGLTEEDPLHIEGTDAVGTYDFNEFTVDEDSLTETVITLFYDELESDQTGE